MAVTVSTEEVRQQKLTRMTTEPVEKLICRLAVPTILSMLVTTFYNMADTYFIGKLDNTSATGAVGVSFALMAIIQAIGFFCGHGSGNFISRALGAQKTDDAETMAATGFVCAFLLGGIVAVGGLLFTAPLARLLGATETIEPYAVEYLTYILCGAPFMCAAIVLNNQLRFQGNALFSCIGILSGAVLNIALDPLFIFTFDMGMSGAALATVISQMVSLCLLYIGMWRSDNLKIRIRNASFRPYFLKNMFKGGLPSLCRQGIAALATSILNNAAGLVVPDDSAIAAMAIVSKVMMLLSSIIIGFGQGFQPVCGYNYGAGKYRRVRRAFWFCFIVAEVFTVVVAAVFYFLAPQVIAFMQKSDENVIGIGRLALQYQLFTLPLTPWVLLSNMCQQTIGRAGSATVLALARQGITLIPCILLLSTLFGLDGLLWAQPAADFLALCIAIPLQVAVLKEFARNPQ